MQVSGLEVLPGAVSRIQELIKGGLMKIHTNLMPERRKSMVTLGAWNDMTITDYLKNAVTSMSEKPAIITYQMADGSRSALNYRELNEKSIRIAAGLAGLGVEKGDIVILPSNSGHWFKRSFGLQRPLG